MINPKSKIGAPTIVGHPKFFRRGVSILEVLFAILVTTVGLFGAIAIFPVASAQARRARLNDMMAAAGRSAFHDFDTRGMRRPSLWLAWNGATQQFVSDFLPTNTTLANFQDAESFCIDPRMIAAQITLSGGKQILRSDGMAPNGVDYGGSCVQTFPYLEPYNDADFNSIWSSNEAYSDLNKNGTHDPPHVTPIAAKMVGGNLIPFDTSLMRRITLRSSPSSAFAMMLPQAESIFLIDDDLSYQRPANDKAVGAMQNATSLSAVSAPATLPWGKRLTDGKISWIATLVPQFDAAGLPSDEYTLSIVMIYERTDLVIDKMKERVVTGTLLNGTGATGGEILLESSDTTGEQLNLKPNDWVMVSGTYIYNPTSTPMQQYSRFQWYRVSHCDPRPSLNSNTSKAELNATLIGEDWNTNFTFPASTPLSIVSPTTVRVTIVEGAYAVYEKTVRLDYGSSF